MDGGSKGRTDGLKDEWIDDPDGQTEGRTDSLLDGWMVG